MIPSQMLKGTLEGCILGIISKEATYGYEISEQLMKYGFGKIAEGTIYPLLLRLEKNELVRATYQASGVGPKRKYYELTAKGWDTLRDFCHCYWELSNAVTALMRDVKGGTEDEQEDKPFAEGKQSAGGATSK